MHWINSGDNYFILFIHDQNISNRACRSARVDFPAEVETRGAEIVEAAIVEYQRGRSSA